MEIQSNKLHKLNQEHGKIFTFIVTKKEKHIDASQQGRSSQPIQNSYDKMETHCCTLTIEENCLQHTRNEPIYKTNGEHLELEALKKSLITCLGQVIARSTNLQIHMIKHVLHLLKVKSHYSDPLCVFTLYCFSRQSSFSQCFFILW